MENYTTGIQHVGLPTKDMTKSVDFYAKLGFIKAWETVFNGDKVVFMRLKNLCMEIYEYKDAAGKPGAIDHVAIDVTDIEAVYAKICSMQLNTMNDEIHFLPFWQNGVKFFTIQGPNAEKVEFSQFL